MGGTISGLVVWVLYLKKTKSRLSKQWNASHYAAHSIASAPGTASLLLSLGSWPVGVPVLTSINVAFVMAFHHRNDEPGQ